ncbi:IFNL3 protein, partial [Climacteris rufus]|nr:IFNL3 protein [Climacteris rufus]
MLCLSLAPLLVLVLGVSLGAAFPHDGPRKGCRLSKYQNIAPDEQKALSKMREEFSLPWLRLQVNDHRCNTRLFQRKWNAVDLPLSDRVVLVAAELNLTTAVLELPAVPGFAEARRRPLDFFTQAREDVRGCVSATPKALPRASSAAAVLLLTRPLSLQADPSHQPSGKLRHWLHKLRVAMRTVSDGLGGCCTPISALTQPFSPPQETLECLRASTIHRVLQVLDNLRCAALQEKC